MAMITKREEMVICPYDEAHVILKGRLQFHLTKCAYANRIKKSKVASCPFNNVHKMPEWELNHHMTTCEDRKKLETEDSTPLFAIKPVVVKSTENWDNVPAGKTYRPNAVIYEKPVLVNLQGVTPSERKAFRADERRRLREYREQQQEEEGEGGQRNRDNYIAGYVRRPKGTARARELLVPLLEEFKHLSVSTTTTTQDSDKNGDDKNPFEDKDGYVVPRYSRRGRARLGR